MSATVQQLTSALATTNASAASTNTAMVSGCNRHTLYLDWTPGVAANVLTILVQGRVNAVTNGSWTQETEWNESPTGTFTPTLRSLSKTAAGTSLLSYMYTFELHAGEIRIMVKESDDGGGGKGTLTSYLVSSTY